jgi:uncharacterized protein
MHHTTETIVLPNTSPGASHQLIVHRWGERGTSKKVYIQAALHADELPGVMAALHLIPLFDAAASEDRIKGEIIMLPYANPVGLAQSFNNSLLGRFAFADGGGNFNRGWPDLGEAVLDLVRDKLSDDASSNKVIMRKALLQAVDALPDVKEKDTHQKALLSLSIDADYVFDLHCAGPSLLHLFAHAEHKDLVMQLACDMSAPVVLLENSINAGLFAECNGGPWIKVRRELNLSPEAFPPACFFPTIEHRGQSDVSDKLGFQDASNIMNFLIRRGIISGDPPALPDALCEAVSVDCCDMVYSPCAGLIAWHKNVGVQVNIGDHLADVIDIGASDPAHARTPIYARQTGLLFAQESDHLVRPGGYIGQIAGKQPLAHRQGESFLVI